MLKHLHSADLAIRLLNSSCKRRFVRHAIDYVTRRKVSSKRASKSIKSVGCGRFDTSLHFTLVPYSFSSFACGPSEPRHEWFSPLILISVIFLLLFCLYGVRLVHFRRVSSGLPFSRVFPRFVFCVSLLVKSGLFACQAFGFRDELNFSVFKYVITDLPDYLTASGLTGVLYSWCSMFAIYGLKSGAGLLFSVRVVIAVFNAIAWLGFMILFLLRCVLERRSLNRWHLMETIYEVVMRGGLTFVFVWVLIVLKREMHLKFRCGLGNLEYYIFTLCFIVIVLQVVQCLFDGVLAFDTMNNECSEMRLILTILFESFADVVPLGFISVVDVVSVPPLEEHPIVASSVFDDE